MQNVKYLLVLPMVFLAMGSLATHNAHKANKHHNVHANEKHEKKANHKHKANKKDAHKKGQMKHMKK